MPKCLILMVLIPLSSFATLFNPVSVKQQILESDQIIQASVVSIDSELFQDKIVSKVTLEVQSSLENSEPTEVVELYYPGGVIGDQVRKVHGAPEFKLGERVVVFAKQRNNKLWIQSLGLSKYSLKTVGSKEIMVNQIFPQNPKMGQIEFEDFKSMVERIKKQKFTTKIFDKYISEIALAAYKTNTNKIHKGRSIASVEDVEEEDKNLSTQWLVLLLGSLVLIFGAIRKKLT